MGKLTQKQIKERTRNEVAKKYRGEVNYWRDQILNLKDELKNLNLQNESLREENKNLITKYEDLKEINKLLLESMDLSKDEILSKLNTIKRIELILSLYNDCIS